MNQNNKKNKTLLFIILILLVFFIGFFLIKKNIENCKLNFFAHSFVKSNEKAAFCILMTYNLPLIEQDIKDPILDKYDNYGIDGVYEYLLFDLEDASISRILEDNVWGLNPVSAGDQILTFYDLPNGYGRTGNRSVFDEENDEIYIYFDDKYQGNNYRQGLVNGFYYRALILDKKEEKGIIVVSDLK